MKMMKLRGEWKWIGILDMQLVKGGTGKLRWYTENNAVSFKNMVLCPIKSLKKKTFRSNGRSKVEEVWKCQNALLGLWDGPMVGIHQRYPHPQPLVSTIGPRADSMDLGDHQTVMVYSWGVLEMTIPKTIGFDIQML